MMIVRIYEGCEEPPAPPLTPEEREKLRAAGQALLRAGEEHRERLRKRGAIEVTCPKCGETDLLFRGKKVYCFCGQELVRDAD